MVYMCADTAQPDLSVCIHASFLINFLNLTVKLKCNRAALDYSRFHSRRVLNDIYNHDATLQQLYKS